MATKQDLDNAVVAIQTAVADSQGKVTDLTNEVAAGFQRLKDIISAGQDPQAAVDALNHAVIDLQAANAAMKAVTDSAKAI